LPGEQAVRVRVDDPGPGHRFDIARQEERARREMVDEHRGLILVRHLARQMAFDRNGASLSLDFDLNSQGR